MSDKRGAWDVTVAEYTANGSPTEQLEYFLRYAILAPSSHNTQPWKFVVGDAWIDVYADYDRWLRIADSEQREMHVSVGCAIENLAIAAEHFGFGTEILLQPFPGAPSLLARVRASPALRRGSGRDSSLFAALTTRRTSHSSYDSKLVSEADLAVLAASAGDDVQTTLSSDITFRLAVEDLMLEADALQFADAEWRSELAHWLGEGAFGQPWFVAKTESLAIKYLDLGRSMGKKDHRALASAPILGVLSCESASANDWVKAGRAFERLWLTAERRGILVQPMNQVLQVPEVRDDFLKLLPSSHFVPAMTFRLGYGTPDFKHTPRRPLLEVIEMGDAPASRADI